LRRDGPSASSSPSAPSWRGDPHNGIENPVAVDPRCNNDKRDFVASTEHLQRWTDTHFDAGKRPVDALVQISSTLGWESHPEFTGLNQDAVRAALGAAV